jgi:RNA methyltransferase, TrmH family
VLTSRQNPLVKEIVKLQEQKERQRTGLMLLEGTNLLTEAVAMGWTLETVCYTEAWAERHQDLLKGALIHRLECVTPSVMEALSTTVTPDGAVATAFRKLPDWQTQLTQGTLCVIAETLQDPGNLGTLLRTATATGAGVILSADSVDPAHPKVLRATAGQWFRRPPAVATDLLTVIDFCQQQGILTYATTGQAGHCFWDLDYRGPVAFVLGNEGRGLSQDLLSHIENHVSIPMEAGVESLNVGISAAILLYEAYRQRRGKP